MILPRHDRYLPIPGGGLGFLSVQNPDPDALCRETAMTRLSAGQFDILTAARRDERGLPLYWTVRDGGKAEVWPRADRDYTLRARDVMGKDPEARRAPVSVFPIAETILAVNRAQEEAARKQEAMVVVETFGRRGVAGGEE